MFLTLVQELQEILLLHPDSLPDSSPSPLHQMGQVQPQRTIRYILATPQRMNLKGINLSNTATEVHTQQRQSVLQFLQIIQIKN